MKIISICLLSLVLVGCQSMPIINDFPQVPATLMEDCKELSTINKPEVLLSEFLETVTRNYGKYHECAAKVEAWKEWYTQQKKVVDDLKSK